MKIKSNDLIGAALDWAVEAALEVQFKEARIVKVCRHEATTPAWIEVENYPGSAPAFHRSSPSTDPAQGWPIIDREGIATRQDSSGKWHAMMSRDLGDGEGEPWCLYTFKGVPRTASGSRQCRFEGLTSLVAAMRCFVASVLGEAVDVPDELVTHATLSNDAKVAVS